LLRTETLLVPNRPEYRSRSNTGNLQHPFRKCVNSWDCYKRKGMWESLYLLAVFHLRRGQLHAVPMFMLN